VLLTAVLVGVGVAPVHAADPYVPAVLEPWRAWVLERHPDHNCPPRYDNAGIRPCVWMRSLVLDLTRSGGRFSADVELFADASVLLPGGGDTWPSNVRTNSGPGVVTSLNGRPRLQLTPGRYTVSGSLAWAKMPDVISVPRQHGLLHLTVDGVAIPEPRQDGDTLSLGKAAATGAEVPSDALTVRVYRKLTDGVPMMLDTYVDLSVAGTHRIVSLGRAMPEGFQTTLVDSQLPARLNANGLLEVQVEPGEWSVHLSGRALGAPTTFAATPDTKDWPAEEIWGFQADRALRVVNIEGASPIDLTQTNAPFKDIPAYVVAAKTELKLVEQFRGDPNPTPDDFTLSRDLWLAFDGSSYTLQDTLNGTVQRPTRLAARFVPGRITVDGEPQLITELGGGAPGIELGSGQHQIVAISALPRPALDTAVGWQTDVGHLSGNLHLPPGWRLLWTHGVDGAPTAWLSTWTLWNIFLVVITVVLALRLIGRGAAAITAATLIVIYHEPGAPIFVWIALLLLLAAVKIGRGRFLTLARGAYFAVLLVTMFGVLSFAIDNLRIAVYPQLDGGQIVRYPETGPSLSVPASAPVAKLSRAAEESFGRIATAGVTAEQKRPTKPRQYENNMQVQTGPGIPTWRWLDAPLIWDGPVTAAQPLALVLSPPWLTRLWHVVGPLLLFLLVAVFTVTSAPPTLLVPAWLKRLAGPVAAALFALPCLLLPAPHARADLPNADLLGDLERRLTKPPDCLPGCAAVEHATVQLDDKQLRVHLVIHAQTAVALPLPAPASKWWPADGEDNKRPATLGRDDSGALTIALTEGVHEIELTGPVVRVDRFELAFPMRPGAVSLELDGWHAFGEQDGQLRGAVLQFEREAPAAAGAQSASLAPEPITPYFRLSRTFQFGIEWRIYTVLERIAPHAGGIPFSIPLVAGESLLDGKVRSEGGRIIGVLPPEAANIVWESALAKADQLQLTAPPVTEWTEQWTLVPSNFWHVDYAGIAPLKLDVDAAAGPRFQPNGGETLTVKITRPTAVPGETITVERALLNDNPGARARRSTLSLSVLSSEGGNYLVTLPADAKILGLVVDGAPQPVPAAGTSLPLPVVPGRQELQVSWEAPRELGALTRASAVELGGQSSNITLNLQLPNDRWPLFVGGPRLGPAVLFWGVLLVVIGVALVLSRIRPLPITTPDAVLLGFGMSLCNLPSTVLVAAWLLILLARQRYAERMQQLGNSSFQLIQTLLALLSIAALVALAASVPYGLLGEPDMQIVGNNSSAHEYHWFQDQAQKSLPGAFVVSLPMWSYRVVMLAWSLWLAFAVLRWVRWGWSAYSAGGIWKSGKPAKESAPEFSPPAG
jgi:hypothetical protein